MPTPQAHLAQATRNEEFANAISGLEARLTEWAVMALFCSALHYVDALLATQGYEARNHHERRNLIAQHTNVSSEYDNLRQHSLDARYELKKFTPEEVELLKADDFRALKEGLLALLEVRP